MDRLAIISVFSLSLLFSIAAQAKTCSVKSPAHRVALLELYTSEGCSSCPPADQWLSRLESQGLDNNKVVPLSLHVDYWNYIGWKDPYSSSQYTSRQRDIASRNRLTTIYTPQMVLQGKDFRSWRRVDFASLVKAINTQTADADIGIAITPKSQNELDIKVNTGLRDSKQYAGGRLVVAIIESGLRSNVSSGENEGRVLSHDYVVRRLFTPEKVSESGKAETSIKLVIPPEWDSAHLGLVAFVEHPVHGTLQALSTKLACN